MLFTCRALFQHRPTYLSYYAVAPLRCGYHSIIAIFNNIEVPNSYSNSLAKHSPDKLNINDSCSALFWLIFLFFGLLMSPDPNRTLTFHFLSSGQSSFPPTDSDLLKDVREFGPLENITLLIFIHSANDFFFNFLEFFLIF